MTRVFVGTSGWHYDDWKERFYPAGLARAKWLGFYATRFSTVELNNTYYRLPSEDAVKNWRASVPQDFVFSVKASRIMTHIKKLRNAKEELALMLKRVGLLQEKLGPLLFQLPPSFERNDQALEDFLSLLPSSTKNVFEFRHQSWLQDRVLDLLRRHRAGFCVFDQPGVPCPVVATSDFAYVRFHGTAYATSYSDDELAAWAMKIEGLGKGLESVFVYFNNDVRGYAINNARTLRQYLKC
jgi:uncharacterized protein YecE (DUF72 family)